MTFDPVWASDEAAEITEPTAAQQATGFSCGPADPGLFNWLFQNLQSAVNALAAGNFVSALRSIATTEGIQGGGTLEADRTLRFDFPGMEAETSIANDDLIPIYDTSAGAHRKMTRANFVAGLGGDTGTGGGLIWNAENIGAGDGEVFASISSGILQFRTIDEGDGVNVAVVGDTVLISLADRVADLTF